MAAVLYGMAATAALLAWALYGDHSWTLPINATTFWWSLPGVPLLLVALLARSWRGALATAVPAVLFLWAYGGLFLGGPPDVEPDLRIASYNTFIQAPDVSHVIELVRDEQPDLLLVQEVQPRRAEELRARLGEVFPHMSFEPREAGRIGGVAVLSRSPILEEQRPSRSAGPGPPRSR